MHPDQVPSPELIREAWIGTNWIVELSATGSCDRRDFRGMLTCAKTLKALVHLVQDRNPGQWGWERFSPCEPQHSTCCGCSVFDGSEPAWADHGSGGDSAATPRAKPEPRLCSQSRR